MTAQQLMAASETRQYATWNPSDIGAGVVLSGGDLTATITVVATPTSYIARATRGKSSGKWYWEITMGTHSVTSDTRAVGVADGSASLSSSLGNDPGAWGYLALDGTKRHNAGSGALGASFTDGDVIGVALDMDGGDLTFYKNGSVQGVAYNLAGLGPIYPAISVTGSSNGNGIMTANFGATAFAYTPPAGYSGLF